MNVFPVERFRVAVDCTIRILVTVSPFESDRMNDISDFDITYRH